jgi:rhamnosyltransferase
VPSGTDGQERAAARLAALKRELAYFYARSAGLRGLVAEQRRPAWLRRSWIAAILRAAAWLVTGPHASFTHWASRRAMRRSGLFDAAWYLETYPDVEGAGSDPLFHYARHGAAEGRQPNRFFDVGWYLLQCPHVAALRLNPLTHYLRSGAARGLSPHPDVLPAEFLLRHPEARAHPTVLHYLVANGLPAADRAVARAGAFTADAVVAGGDRRVCAFSHFDAGGRILGYVRHYLAALARQGFEIHLISSAPRLDPGERIALEAGGVRIHMRENRGRDFGSWQWGLREIPVLADADTLLLANDSVFGPLFDPAELFAAMRATPADVWGITDSPEMRWHLQSYFLCFSRRARESRAFRDVFAQDFASFRDKREIIDRGEVALTQALVAEGLTARAYCPYDRIAPVPGQAEHFNPT